MLITPKRLKLRTSIFTRIFQGQSGHVPLKIFRKRSWPGPPKFLVSRADHTHLVHRRATKWVSSCDQICNSHFFKYFFAIFNDRPFKFYTKLKREEYKRFVYTMAHKWALSGSDQIFCNSWRQSIQILDSVYQGELQQHLCTRTCE